MSGADDAEGAGGGGAAGQSHWLLRLDAPSWLAAADNELVLCDQQLGRRAYRPAITHARRAAGMALNAVLAHDVARAKTAGGASAEPVASPEPAASPVAGVSPVVDRWGRSYMDHLKAVPDDVAVPEAVRAACRLLVDTPPAPPALVPLGKPDRRAHDAAALIVAWCRERTEN